MIKPNKKAHVPFLNATGLMNCLRNYTFNIRKSFSCIGKEAHTLKDSSQVPDSKQPNLIQNQNKMRAFAD
jgi:hypothetical protein